METRRRYRRHEDAAVIEDGGGRWEDGIIDVLIGVVWLLLTLATGGLFLAVLCVAAIAGAPRAGLMLRQLCQGILGIVLALAPALVIVAVFSA